MYTLIATYVSHRYFAYKTGRYADRKRFNAWQNEQVVRFLHKIVPRSPFYQDHFLNYDLADWQSLPTIDKEIMMGNFSRLNTVGLTKEVALALALRAEETRDFAPQIGNITVGLSSGTSGNRGLFLVSNRERQRWAGAALARLLDHSLLSRQRIAFFLRANSRLYETVNSRQIRFHYFDLLTRPEDHIARLNQLRPTYLIGPPSLLRFLADAARDDRLKIEPFKIISVAETLDRLDKEHIESVFQQPLHQVYQCTEGFLGSTCRHGTLHLHEDIVAIQKERFSPDGIDQSARKFMPIITDFSRETQPIIRYRLNDILTEAATPCPCGSVLTPIEMIEGRQDDIFYLPSLHTSGEDRPRALVPLFPDYVRRAVIRASDEIVAYRVEQLDATRWQVELAFRHGDDPAVSAALSEIENRITTHILELTRRLGVEVPHIQFSRLPPELPSVLKRRRVQRSWDLQ